MTNAILFIAAIGFAAIASPTAFAAPSSGCPSGYEPAVGTLYDSWPKAGSVECEKNGGCVWPGHFADIEAGGETKSSCRVGAKVLPDVYGNKPMCRFPEALIRKWKVGAALKGSKLLGKKVEVTIQGGSGKAIVNVEDSCSDGDCKGCCTRNSGDGKFELIDMEKHAAASLLGYSADSVSDINNVKYPTAKGMRSGVPETNVMPLCYKIIGDSNVKEISESFN